MAEVTGSLGSSLPWQYREEAGEPMDLTEEKKQAWIAKHLANAPERDDAWYEQIDRIYRAGLREAEVREQRRP